MSLEAAQLALGEAQLTAQQRALTLCTRVERQVFRTLKAWYVHPTNVREMFASLERTVEHGLTWITGRSHELALLPWEKAVSAHPALFAQVLEAKGFWHGVVSSLFEPPPYQEIVQIIFTPVAGKTWSERLQELSSLVQDKYKLAADFADAFALGKTLDEIRKIVKPLVQDVDVSARRIVRTEGMRVVHAIQDRTDKIAERYGAIQGYRYRATLDSVVRPRHAARHGFVYSSQEERVPLPDGPNCRCYYEPIVKTPVMDQTGLDRDYRVEFYKWLSQQTPARKRQAIGEEVDGWDGKLQEKIDAFVAQDPEKRSEAVRHARIVRLWDSRNQVGRGRAAHGSQADPVVRR